VRNRDVARLFVRQGAIVTALGTVGLLAAFALTPTGLPGVAHRRDRGAAARMSDHS
jgi:hypothetical protein